MFPLNVNASIIAYSQSDINDLKSHNDSFFDNIDNGESYTNIPTKFKYESKRNNDPNEFDLLKRNHNDDGVSASMFTNSNYSMDFSVSKKPLYSKKYHFP